MIANMQPPIPYAMHFFVVNLIYWILIVTFVLMVIEIIVIKRTGKGSYDWRETAGTIGLSLIGYMEKYLPLGGGLYLFSMEVPYRLFNIPWNNPWGLLLLLLTIEFLYYWKHRAVHAVRLLWVGHSVHHSARTINFSAGQRLDPFTTITSGVLVFVPLLIIGFHPMVVLAFYNVNFLYQIWTHSEVVPKLPAWFEYIFNTPYHHRLHHAHNKRAYTHCNYGGTLIIYDRIFGTYVESEPEEALTYGIKGLTASANPVKVLLHEWIRLGKSIRAQKTLLGKLRAIFV